MRTYLQAASFFLQNFPPPLIWAFGPPFFCRVNAFLPFFFRQASCFCSAKKSWRFCSRFFSPFSSIFYLPRRCGGSIFSLPRFSPEQFCSLVASHRVPPPSPPSRSVFYTIIAYLSPTFRDPLSLLGSYSPPGAYCTCLVFQVILSSPCQLFPLCRHWLCLSFSSCCLSCFRFLGNKAATVFSSKGLLSPKDFSSFPKRPLNCHGFPACCRTTFPPFRATSPPCPLAQADKVSIEGGGFFFLPAPSKNVLQPGTTSFPVHLT